MTDSKSIDMPSDSPYTTITVERWNKLQDVLHAADRLVNAAIEFPSDPGHWSEYLPKLEAAVKRAKA